MARWVIIEVEHWFGGEGIRILVRVIGVCMMSPVLCEPRPLATANKVGTKSKKVVNVWLLRGSAVVCVMLLLLRYN